MNYNDIARKRAVTRNKWLALVMFLCGIELIVLGILAACWHHYIKEDQTPLFVGSFILGGMAIGEALMSMCIFRKGLRTYDPITKKELECILGFQFLLAFALFGGCIACIVITVKSGRLSRDAEDKHARENQVLAIVTLASGVFMLFVSMYNIFVICVYGDYLKTSATKPGSKPAQKKPDATTKIATSSTANSTEIAVIELQKLKDQNATLIRQMEEQQGSAQRGQLINQQNQQQLQQQLQELKTQQLQFQQQFQYPSASAQFSPPPSYMEVAPAPKEKTVP